MLGCVAVLAAAQASAAGLDFVRPGDGVGVPPVCTLGFFYRDVAGVVYGSTAAHCVAVGDVVQTHRGKLGTVVYEEAGDTDTALIRVSDNIPWAPGVRGLAGPNGIATHADTTLGDILRTTGQGVVVRDVGVTQSRYGVLVGDTPSEFWWDTVATPGDSGAPVLRHADGKAVGTVSRVGAERAATDEGPSVPLILLRMRSAGYDVGLVNADGTTARIP